MNKPKCFGDLPIEVKVKFIKDTFIETYPFTLENLEDYEKDIDFKILSSNQKMEWSAEIIERFIYKWDWFAIESNYVVCEDVNLGLLFPDKVSIVKPKCECRKQLEFCSESKPCLAIYDESKIIPPKKESINPKLYGFIEFLIEDGYYGKEMLNSVLQYNIIIDNFDDYELYYEPEKEDDESDYVPF